MRPLEILIPIVLSAYVLWPLTGKQRPGFIGALPAFTLAVIVAHSLLEGTRWQMGPLYIFAGLATLVSLLSATSARKETNTRRTWRTWVRVSLSLGLLAVSTALPILLPVPSIPSPTGTHQVGTQAFVLTDAERLELYSGKDEARRFIVQVWYPASPDPDNQPAPWMNDAPVFARAISNYLELPEFFLDHLSLVQTPAYLDAPLEQSGNGYPVILFSHGWNGFAAQNAGQAIELASRGYVVAALQHTYGARVTVFPDGEVAPNYPDALPSGAPDDVYEQAADVLADQWAGDMAFALDFLAAENQSPDSPFFNTLDLTEVGVYGHSTGGGAAIQFCGTDARCTALLGMDPFMRPVSSLVQESGLSQPAFFMFSQSWVDDTDSLNNRLFSQFYARLDSTTGVMGIQGTSHFDFSDLPMLSPVAAQLGLKGPLNGKRVTEIVSTYLIGFFDSTLNNQPTDLFDGPSDQFPEVIWLLR